MKKVFCALTGVFLMSSAVVAEDYHVLSENADKSVSVVFHIPVPVGSNGIGTTWRDAVVIDQGGVANIQATPSSWPDISASEQTQRETGEIIEQTVTVRYSRQGLNNTQKRNEVEAAWTAAEAQFQSAGQARLGLTGFSANVP